MTEIFTIGHSNLKADAFLDLAKGAGINMIVDVRSKPSSRFPHFGRDNFIRLVRPAGIDYLWGGRVLGGLNPIEPENPMFVEKMDKIISIAQEEGRKVALMCSEGNPCECHRAGKCTAWLHKHHPDIKISHVVKGGEILSNEQVLPGVKSFLRWPSLSY